MGKPMRMTGVNIDVTDRQQAKQALLQSEERFRLAIKATNDSIWDIDLETGTVTWNETYSTLFVRPPRPRIRGNGGSPVSTQRTASAPSAGCTLQLATAHRIGPASTVFSGRMAGGPTSTTAHTLHATRPVNPGALSGQCRT